MQLASEELRNLTYRASAGSDAHIFVGLQVTSAEDRKETVRDLRKKQYAIEDMTENEVAKLHVRHMVGGRTQDKDAELLFRFEFPERPGALVQFLAGLGADWNITLFHYRNHGSAFGRVLVGFSADRRHRAALAQYLKKIGYRFWEETDNPAYNFFLK